MLAIWSQILFGLYFTVLYKQHSAWLAKYRLTLFPIYIRFFDIAMLACHASHPNHTRCFFSTAVWNLCLLTSSPISRLLVVGHDLGTQVDIRIKQHWQSCVLWWSHAYILAVSCYSSVCHSACQAIPIIHTSWVSCTCVASYNCVCGRPFGCLAVCVNRGVCS